MPDDATSSVLAITSLPTRGVFSDDHDILPLCQAPTVRILMSLVRFSVAVRGNLFLLALL
jgi:hypothetical protein